MTLLFDPRARALHFAVRLSVIFKYLGQMLLVFAALTLVPLVISILIGEYRIAARYGGVICFLLIAGWLASRIKEPSILQRNEALVISALMFILPSALMVLPFSAYGIPSWDAFFEAVSGLTTTGLTTLPSIEDTSPVFLFTRAWLQWVGGLGIVVLALALIHPGVASVHLGFDRYATEDIAGGTRAHARRVLRVYAAMTLAGFLLLWALGMGLFDATAYTLAAVSTGGFSPYKDSLAKFNWPVHLGVIVLCFAGATPFYSYYDVRYRKWSILLKDLQLRALFATCLASAALVFFFMMFAGQWSSPTQVQDALLTSFFAQTTAGFSKISLATLNSASIFVLICSMTIGGGLGSTAGGIKIFRFVILVRLLQLTLVRASVPPGTKLDLRLRQHHVESQELEVIVAIVLGYLGMMAISWLLFLAYGYDPLASLFEVASALGTVGLSTGIAGPHLEASLKGVLCIDMLMGRVETVAIIVLLFPATWLGRRRDSQ